MEYVGVVVGTQTADDKLAAVSTVLDVNKPIFLVKLDETRYLDLAESGNTARFVNHRCLGFNAQLRKVKAQNDVHILLEAVKAIAEGEEITRCYEEITAQSMAKDKHCQCPDHRPSDQVKIISV